MLDFQFSQHARDEIARRGIPRSLLDEILQQPEQVAPAQGGRVAYQSRVSFGAKLFLIRAIVARDVEPPLVVTVYRTSKIAKYWRAP